MRPATPNPVANPVANPAVRPAVRPARRRTSPRDPRRAPWPGGYGPAEETPRLWVAGTEPAPPPAPPALGPAGRGERPPAVFAHGAGAAGAAVARWRVSGPATIAVLRDELTAAAAGTLLAAVRHAIHTGGRLVLVHTGAGGASLLHTLGRERPALSCLTVELAAPTPAALAAARDLVRDPARARRGQPAEVIVDPAGGVHRTRWLAAEPGPPGDPPGGPRPAHGGPRPAPGGPPLAPGEPVLITGGLGGLGRAVAGHLARRYRAHPVLLDLPEAIEAGPHPRHDRANGHATGTGAGAWSLIPADVTDAAALRAALAPRPGTPGARRPLPYGTAGPGQALPYGTAGPGRHRPFGALIHCAGLVTGGRVAGLLPADLAEVAAPKVGGLRAVLAALEPRPPRVVVAFGSILARRPHPGVGGYALANELLRREVDRCARSRQGPRYLTAEWSIWDGAGIAARTGAVAVARQAGYVPIPLAAGLAVLDRLLTWPGPATAVVVSARPPLAEPEPQPRTRPYPAPPDRPRTVRR